MFKFRHLHKLPGCWHVFSPRLVQVRTVTDIEYYREVDQSHLHLVPAQSTFRQFLIKLKEKEMREKRMMELKLALETGQDLTSETELEDEDEVEVGSYIERRPSEILE